MKKVFLFCFLFSSLSLASGDLFLKPEKLMGSENESKPMKFTLGLSVKESLGKLFVEHDSSAVVTPKGVATEHEWASLESSTALGMTFDSGVKLSMGVWMMKEIHGDGRDQSIYSKLSTPLW